MNKKEIGQRIMQRRRHLKMSQHELATKIGYQSRTSINKIELGKSAITLSKIMAYAEVLETSPEYIIGLSDDLDTNNEKLCHHFVTRLCPRLIAFLKRDRRKFLIIFFA
ncbi:XRE family transcriptional regulator [bacterium]|nr:XRE family transcriptional regulator [bacterium]